jgi:predicted nucleic acid-binding Zn finger protein
MDEELRALFSRERSLTPEVRDAIIQACGERGRKALKAIDEQRIKQYRDFTVVVGISDEYIVDEEFCTCQASRYRRGRCWHILAVEIAGRVNAFEVIDAWYQENPNEEGAS